MLRLLLARHGETTGNAEGRCQGQDDVPMTPRGHEQAARLAARLASESFTAIYASDLSRAWDTARAIAAHHPAVPLHAEPRLREQSKGIWDGMLWEDIYRDYAAAWAAYQADRDHVPPGGERLSDVVARLATLARDIAQAHPDGQVLLVAHGAVLRTLICLQLGIDPALTWNFHLDNTGLAELRAYPDGWVLHRLNDTCHLG